MVVIRYEGPRGAPGMPELLDPTSRITALCRQRHITIALMTDARFSGGSVGLVIGHVAPEALLGGPIALVEDGDTHRGRPQHRPPRLRASSTSPARSSAGPPPGGQAVEGNGGIHPDAVPVTDRVLARMRATALPALLGRRHGHDPRPHRSGGPGGAAPPRGCPMTSHVPQCAASCRPAATDPRFWYSSRRGARPHRNAPHDLPTRGVFSISGPNRSEQNRGST